MEISLYNTDGEAVAYIADDGEASIYTWEGEAVAYIVDGGIIYGWCGQHIGWFADGILYDLNGYRVGFVRERCPVAVYAEYAKYAKFAKYAKYARYAAYARPAFSYGNSEKSLIDFLRQDAP